ncbi:MAG: hypothetical protein C5B56_02945 [Proteobacteria bacterium]|nr:MAG: hypothetical protein C5B56_02945 [Pseudomonadota bacterium]
MFLLERAFHFQPVCCEDMVLATQDDVTIAAERGAVHQQVAAAVAADAADSDCLTCARHRRGWYCGAMFAARYSITSVAVASSVAGTVRPSALGKDQVRALVRAGASIHGCNSEGPDQHARRAGASRLPFRESRLSDVFM